MNKLFFGLTFFLLLASVGGSSASARGETGFESFLGGYIARNIEYGNQPGQYMDLLLPDTSAGNEFPVIVFFQGSAIVPTGSKSFWRDPAHISRVVKLISGGLAVAVPYYAPLSENDTNGLMRIFQDGSTATRFLCDEAASLHIDKSRMAYWGVSAGAGIALWNGLKENSCKGANVRAIVAMDAQATYDLSLWPKLLPDLKLNPDSIVSLIGIDKINLIYGTRSLPRLKPITVIRKSLIAELDVLESFDSEDPPVWFESIPDTAYKGKLRAGDLMHHPRHAAALKRRADKCQPVPLEAYLRTHRINQTGNYRNAVAFLFDKLGVPDPGAK